MKWFGSVVSVPWDILSVSLSPHADRAALDGVSENDRVIDNQERENESMRGGPAIGVDCFLEWKAFHSDREPSPLT